MLNFLDKSHHCQHFHSTDSAGSGVEGFHKRDVLCVFRSHPEIQRSDFKAREGCGGCCEAGERRARTGCI